MEYRFYVGSYAQPQEEAISRYRVDFEKKMFVKELACCNLDWPSFLLMHPNGKILYAGRELTTEGAIHAFEVRGDQLLRRGTWETGGSDPCNMCLDDEARFLFVANYSGSNVSVFALDKEGIPTAMVENKKHTGSGPLLSRQRAPHPHCVYYRDGLLFVCDLGTDTVYRYVVDKESGRLTASWSISVPGGAGPRHLTFHPRHPELLYVIGEMSSEIYLFRLEEERAVLLQTVSTLPGDFTRYNIASGIKFAPDGKTLFASNRGHESIAVYQVEDSGRLQIRQHCPSGGVTPRDFTLFGDYLLVGNQDSNNISVFHYDAAAYALTRCPMTLKVTAPSLIMKWEG